MHLRKIGVVGYWATSISTVRTTALSKNEIITDLFPDLDTNSRILNMIRSTRKIHRKKRTGQIRNTQVKKTKKKLFILFDCIFTVNGVPCDTMIPYGIRALFGFPVPSRSIIIICNSKHCISINAYLWDILQLYTEPVDYFLTSDSKIFWIRAVLNFFFCHHRSLHFCLPSLDC